MKCALIAIAAEFEKPYLYEWLSYHKNIGFDICLYLNNWNLDNTTDEFKLIDHIFQINGEAKQLVAYNDFILNRSYEYDWALILDCDEFLNLNKFISVNEVFALYNDYLEVGFNWVLFGDNHLTNIINNDYSVLNRFTKSQAHFNKHVKTAINLNKIRQSGEIKKFAFNNPHCTYIDCNALVKVSADRHNFIIGPFNHTLTSYPVLDYKFPYINHYFCKTFEEYKYRRSFGKADIRSYDDNGNKILDHWRTDDEFGKHNFNEIENKMIFNI